MLDKVMNCGLSDSFYLKDFTYILDCLYIVYKLCAANSTY